MKYIDSCKNRCIFIIKIFLFSILFIWIYVFYLQIIKYNYFFEKSCLNFTRYKNINGLRGSILDRNGIPIVTTSPILKLIWNNRPKKLSVDDEKILFFLKEYLKIDFLEKIKNNTEDKILLINDLNFEQLSLILECFPNSNRILIETSSKRNYKYNTLACHTIGYINFIENSGKTGLEKIFNKNLEGKIGTEKLIVNSIGSVLLSEIINKAEEGEDVITTLDLEMQKSLERSIPEDFFGSGVIINPENGAILAIVSSPRFDPNIFLSSIDNKTWNNFLENKTLLNRCFLATYPPGSIFKLVCMTAMLEEGLINEKTSWFCSGGVDFKDRCYHCDYRLGHGPIDIKNTISKSCNTPFFLASISNLTIDLIYKYATIFGFGKPTGSCFNELNGLVPNKQWKKSIKNEKWYKGETLSVSIGQGATIVTPIQIARLIGGIMTGYLVKPRILEDEDILKNKLNIRFETLNIIKEGMNLSTKEGSNRILKSLKNWEIFAKTGTAQVRMLPPKDNKLKKDELKIKKYQHHGLMACYAKNKKCEPFVLVIVIENVGSSRVAVSCAKEFFKDYESKI